MKNRYRLEGLGSDQLLAALPVLVQRGNENTADLLAHLAELDERKLFLDLGYPSLFAYCIEVLGLCESAAGRRTTAARVCRRFPNAFARLAGRFPRPDVRNQIRRLPAGWGLEPLSAGRYGVHFTADSEFRELLEKARALTSHRSAAGDLAGLMKLGLEALIRETEKKRFAVGRRPKVHPPGGRKVEGRRSRHVPAAVAREVYLRDDGQRTFVAKDRKRCACRNFIEIDHINPYAVGGASNAENLRLRCQAHNQQHARKCFGKGYIQAVIARTRGDRQTSSGLAGDQNGAHAGAFGGQDAELAVFEDQALFGQNAHALGG
jgi:hypothetical protein